MLTIPPARPFVNRQSRCTHNGESPSSAQAYESRFNREEDDFYSNLAETIRWTVTRRIEQSCRAYVTAVVGRDHGQRRNRRDTSQAAERCHQCGTQRRSQFYRKGHRPRNLDTPWGRLRLQVQRVECLCGGDVGLTFPQFAPFSRRSPVLTAEILLLIGFCLPLRQVRAVLDMRGVKLSVTTIAGEVSAAADIAEQTFSEKAQDAPPVIMLDGIYVNITEETGEVFRDRRGRQRKRQHVRKRPVLIAWGVYPDTGKKVLLNWAAGKAEDETSWLKLLKKLSKQGICYRNGLRLFIHDGSGGLEKAFEQITFGPVQRQRCIFHKMRNVVEAVQGEDGMTPQEKRERRAAVLVDLTRIWEAQTKEEAKSRCEQFAAKWGEKEPKAVEKLRNGFEATIVYYEVEEAAREQGHNWERRYLRTTSLHERWNRFLRRRARTAVVFRTERGLLASAYLALGCQGNAATGKLRQWLNETMRSTRRASVAP